MEEIVPNVAVTAGAFWNEMTLVPFILARGQSRVIREKVMMIYLFSDARDTSRQYELGYIHTRRVENSPTGEIVLQRKSSRIAALM